MTPAKAIRLNCRFCNGGARAFPKCASRICALNNKGLSTLKRIKRYCVDCAAGHKPEECNGQLIGTQRKMLAEIMGVSVEEAICPLLPFRFGKNPNKSHPCSKKRLEILRKGRLGLIHA